MWDVNENESIWDFDVPPPNVLDNSLIAMTPPRRRSSGDSARSHSHDIPDFFPYARRSSSGSGSNNSRRSNSVGQPQINRRSSSRVYMPSRRAQTNAQAHVDWEKLSLQKYLTGTRIPRQVPSENVISLDGHARQYEKKRHIRHIIPYCRHINSCRQII